MFKGTWHILKHYEKISLGLNPRFEYKLMFNDGKLSNVYIKKNRKARYEEYAKNIVAIRLNGKEIGRLRVLEVFFESVLKKLARV